MTWWTRVRSRLEHWLRPRAANERDLQDEIDFHLSEEARLQAERGLAPENAHAAARRDFGNVILIKEATRAMWGWTSVERVTQDVRHACRTLLRTPGFTAVATLSLALGIGANTAIFQLLDAVGLRSLPVERPHELIEVQIAHPRSRIGAFRGRRPELTYAQWQQIRNHQQAFSGLFAWGTTGFNLSSGGEVRIASGMMVSGDMFRVLGVPAVLGRTLTVADDQRGCTAPPAVISHGFWEREFGGDPHVVGRHLSLERHAAHVVGVMPRSFYGVEVGRQFDVAIPLCAQELIGSESALDAHDTWWLAVIGRLNPGWSRERAADHLRSISPAVFDGTVPPAYRADAAKAYRESELTALPAASGVSNLRRDYETPLYILLAISALVLVIACANVANLMLARATGRQGELAVRVAVGASRGRLVHQLITESLVLAVVGAALGALVAQWVSRLLVAFLTTESARLHLDLPLDLRVLTFLAGLAAITCLLSGLIPALRATQVTPARVIQTIGRGLTAHRERFRMQRALVVSQVALSLVLLVGALLFVRTLSNLVGVDLGFQPDDVLVVDVDLPGSPPEQRALLIDRLDERVRALPNVESAAYTSIVPMSGSGSNNMVWMEGGDRNAPHLAQMSTVSPRYFSTVGTRMIAGRDFDRRDTVSSPKVAIVTETFVKMVAGGANPIGRRFVETGNASTPDQTYEVVGIVEDSKYFSARDEQQPIAFMAAAQLARPDFPAFLLRIRGPSAPVFAAARRAIAEIDRHFDIESGVLANSIRERLLRERLVALLATAFAVLAALLVTLGLYGVLSYMVTRRNNEIGIRIALGAARGRVAAMFAREAVTLVVVGVVIGLGLASASGRLAGSLLYGLQPSDPTTMGMAAALLVVIAIIAAYLPAWRAARVDPVVALRSD
jgi:putative ABC transport system permease protein